MRISDSKELGVLLQKEFGGKLKIDKLGQICVTKVSQTSQEEVKAFLTTYYTQTLNCTIPLEDSELRYWRDLSFQNERGYEVITLSYSPNPINEIQIFIADMSAHPAPHYRKPNRKS